MKEQGEKASSILEYLDWTANTTPFENTLRFLEASLQCFKNLPDTKMTNFT